MTLDTIFTVRNEHLQRLKPDEAVRFFADLLKGRDKATRTAGHRSEYLQSYQRADGGVDAAVDAEVRQYGATCKTGRTVFQIKAGDFKPWQPAAIREELFGDRDPTSKDRRLTRGPSISTTGYAKVPLP